MVLEREFSDWVGGCSGYFGGRVASSVEGGGELEMVWLWRTRRVERRGYGCGNGLGSGFVASNLGIHLSIDTERHQGVT